MSPCRKGMVLVGIILNSIYTKTLWAEIVFISLKSNKKKVVGLHLNHLNRDNNIWSQVQLTLAK